MNVNQNTKLNLVIGHPLTHTQSPLLHNTIYQNLKINAVLLAISNHDLSSLVKSIKALSVELTAVTMPYKETILNYLDDYSPEVKTLRAANTIIQKNGQLFGYNTDIHGILYAFRDIDLKSKTVLVLGAGGAARSMGYVLQQNNAHIYWMNRTPKKAEILAEQFGGAIIQQSYLHTIFPDIIVNTTPLGMYLNTKESPLPGFQFNPQQIVFDMVYNPIDTALLKLAKEQNAKIISGLEMFIGQGLAQIELWTGQKIQTNQMLSKIEILLKSVNRP